MARSKSSNKWLGEHFSDEFVKRAQQEGYRSRAVYKLLEIQDKDGILRPGMRVVDLGAAPGGWSQVAKKLVGSRGQVVALDILPMEELPGVEFIQGDFREETVLQQLLAKLDNQPLDLVICDLAPNMSGNKQVDIAQAMYLSELALELAQLVLKKDGTLLVKVFHGSGFEQLLAQTRQQFGKVVTRKPQASRARSRECYLLAKHYNM